MLEDTGQLIDVGDSLVVEDIRQLIDTELIIVGDSLVVRGYGTMDRCR